MAAVSADGSCSWRWLPILSRLLLLPTAVTPAGSSCSCCSSCSYSSWCSMPWLLFLPAVGPVGGYLSWLAGCSRCCDDGCCSCCGRTSRCRPSSSFLPSFTPPPPPHPLLPPLLSWELSSLLLCSFGGCSWCRSTYSTWNAELLLTSLGLITQSIPSPPRHTILV